MVYCTSKTEQTSNAIEKASVSLRSFGCVLSIFAFVCSFDKVLQMILLICISDEYFGTWTVV